MPTLHKDINPSSNHALHTWASADEAARLAISVTSYDHGKICWQQNDDTLWILKNHSPVVWKPVRNDSPVYKFNNKGSVSGAAVVDASLGAIQRVTCTGAVTIGITGWPAAGFFGELMLEVDGAANISALTGVKWIKSDGTVTTDITQNGATRQTAGNVDFILLWTRDGGSTVYGKFVR